MDRFWSIFFLLVLFLLPPYAFAETLLVEPVEGMATASDDSPGTAANPSESAGAGEVLQHDATRQGISSPEQVEGMATASDGSPGTAANPSKLTGEAEGKGDISPESEPAQEEVAEGGTIADPFEPLNRLAFTFNDRLYFWVMKPVYKVYNVVVPEPVRVAVRNFFHNITTPVRFVNCLLQGKLKAAGNELFRLGLNSTLGMAGFFDLAKTGYDVGSSEEDLGLTFGHYGGSNGFYIVWPFLGPSTLRDSIGMAGDAFLNPENYITPFRNALAVEGGDYFNRNSLRIGEYEELKNASIEPYTAFRDAYIQYRKDKLKQ